MNINLGQMFDESVHSNNNHELNFYDSTSRVSMKKGSSPLGLGGNNLSFQPLTPVGKV